MNIIIHLFSSIISVSGKFSQQFPHNESGRASFKKTRTQLEQQKALETASYCQAVAGLGLGQAPLAEKCADFSYL